MSGSIVKYKDGWRVFASAGRDVQGKRRRITEVVKGTRRDAQRRLRELQTALDSGAFVARRNLTLRQLVDAWWPGKAASVSPTTAEGYRKLLDGLILPALGSKRLQGITSRDIATFLSSIVKRGTIGQADHAFVLLRLFFNSAIKGGEIVRSPMQGVDRPRAPHKEMLILLPAEWQRVREYLAQHRPAMLLPFTVLITSGVRRSELAGLKWGDFDAGRQLLRIHRAVHVLPGGRYVEEEPKTARSRRTVALDNFTARMPIEHQRESERIAEMFGRELADSDYIFGRLDRRLPCHPQALSDAWRRTVRALELPSIRLHDLRHTAASLLLAAGVDAKLISERLGHSSVGFTLTVYGHLMPGAQAEAAEKLAIILGNGHPREALPVG